MNYKIKIPMYILYIYIIYKTVFPLFKDKEFSHKKERNSLISSKRWNVVVINNPGFPQYFFVMIPHLFVIYQRKTRVFLFINTRFVIDFVLCYY